MSNTAEGWIFTQSMRKAHYQRDGRTLCGKYGLYPASALTPDDGQPNSDDCTACRRKLDQAKGGTRG